MINDDKIKMCINFFSFLKEAVYFGLKFFLIEIHYMKISWQSEGLLLNRMITVNHWPSDLMMYTFGRKHLNTHRIMLSMLVGKNLGKSGNFVTWTSNAYTVTGAYTSLAGCSDGCYAFRSLNLGTVSINFFNLILQLRSIREPMGEQPTLYHPT